MKLLKTKFDPESNTSIDLISTEHNSSIKFKVAVYDRDTNQYFPYIKIFGTLEAATKYFNQETICFEGSIK